MQYLTAFFTVLLVASASALPAQPEQVQNSNSGEYSPGHNKPIPPPQHFNGHLDHADFHYNPTLSQQFPAEHLASVVSGQQQNVPVVTNQQASVAQPVSVNQQAPVVVEANGPQVNQLEQQQPPHHHPSVASYYAPAGLINVVGEQPSVNKPPVSSVRNFEQYGQPESASMPPNYKPFGSWGLYIGGNPADGYYTNYYKSLGASVDKQQVGEPVGVKPVSPVALSPVLRQASSSPYVSNDYYSFAYSPSDLSSASRVSVEPVHSVSHSPVPAVSPVQAGAQVYGSPAAFESNYGISPYADLYATKKVGAAYAQKEVKEVSAPKGYQPRVYVYQPVVASPVAPLASPVAPSAQVQGSPQQQQQQQVVAYPVPVGSQIVGSQPGVEGAFNPYGVHGFTRYAVKPTVVSQDPSYYYGVSSPHQLPAYKQQVYQSQQVGSSSYYPLSYYGYPLSQLHYSQGSVVPQVGQNEAHHVPVQPQVEAASSEKTESEDKSVNNKQQKRA